MGYMAGGLFAFTLIGILVHFVPILKDSGAAPLAAALQERDRLVGKKVAVVQSGGNIDRALFTEILAERN